MTSVSAAGGVVMVSCLSDLFGGGGLYKLSAMSSIEAATILAHQGKHKGWGFDGSTTSKLAWTLGVET
jgi:hypothetical protein